ncbi:TonB-dependent receptor plug domain-containing protein [Aliiglaciecola aliphaticivorans]
MKHKNQLAELKRKPKPRFNKSMIALAIMGFSSQSFAQDVQPSPAAEDTDVEIINVRGVRSSVIRAQELKREADTFVDAITASDIGALPDRSVLEAMQRIPGISIERFAAANDPDHFGVEGSGAVIRGMSATRSEFNGRDSFTANSGRGLSFQDVPPELMGSVRVYKNQSADLIEGGIGGTVSLHTRLPFDSDERIVAVSADLTYSDLIE